MSDPGQEAGGQGRPSAQDTGSTRGQDELALRMGDLARFLEEEDDPEQTLEKVVRAAVDLIPGADEGSISVVTHRRDVESRAPSSDLPRQVDALQSETGQGPCMDAVFQHATVRVPDMSTEDRWPEFASRACAAGAASMLSFQLYVDGDNLGALNLYSHVANAFDDESEHVGLLFAAHAAIAYAGVTKQEQLTHAVETRDRIGQAKGVLMERYTITADQAFALLSRYSQHSNRKLVEVAGEVVTLAETAAREQ